MEEGKICKDCGKPFIPKTVEQKYCCKACYKRANKREHGRRHKRNRVKMSKDKTVSLITAYNRADGRCWICGRKCNFKDYKVIDGRWYCGPSYPTRDHIRPISEGGKTNFNNILLACWECNNKKDSTCSRTTYFLAESFRREIKYMKSHPEYKPSSDVDEYPELGDIEF